MLRSLLLDPENYQLVPWLCIFEPEYAFSVQRSEGKYYVVLGTECHQLAIHGPSSEQFGNLTAKAAANLQAFCEGLFPSSPGD